VASRSLRAVRVVGSNLERELEPGRPRLWLGTDPGCDLVLTSRFVSARHASLDRDGDRVVCRDQGSTNGLWLGEHRVDLLEVRAERPFRVGDQWLIGVSAEAQAARRHLQRWLGHAERWQPAVDDGLRVVIDRRHAVITGAAGARLDALAHLLHDALATGPRPRVDAGDVRITDPLPLLAAARGGSLVVAAAALPDDLAPLRDRIAAVATDVRLLVIADRDQVARACTLVPGAVVIEVPTLSQRRDDLLRLVVDIGADVARRRRWSADLGAELPALLGHGWPGNLDELEDSVERVLAVRATGSMRAAEDALGVSKSAIGRTLKRLGLDRAQKLTR
jgi:hypothetical protein